MIRPTTFNITTLLLIGLTCWVLWIRHRSRLENNWPLLYYVALVAYSKKFDEVVPPFVVLGCVVAALLLRFEFLGGWVLKGIKVIESAALVYVLLRALQALFLF
ncbi:MAG: hypothetical protein HY235_15805 [Acidobacteria bacterium]|nr:hypothetical protein [Acidobacteriota bacterium]